MDHHNEKPRRHQVFIARQPIFDRNLDLFAYELLFRDAETAAAHIVDGDAATSQVLINAFSVIGLDQLVGDRLAFINFSGDYLLERPRISLPTDHVVLELLEDSHPTDALIARLAALRQRGFQVALDDFVYRDELIPLLKVADIVKVQLPGLSRRQLAEHVERLRAYPLKLLAEKVETQDEFELCHALGFDYFQGFFLSRPRIMRHNALPVHRLPTLRLLAALNDPDSGVEQLERVIAEDVTLSYRLLRYLNSSQFPTRTEIGSIRHAILYLGVEELRSWASMLAMVAVDDKPEELIAALMARARMCENLAKGLGFREPARFFSLGLFSGLDALLETPLEDIVTSLNLSRPARVALLEHEGEAGRILECALSYERGDWERIAQLGIPHDVAIRAYLDAIGWTDNARQEW